jgi:hypothetical protein
MTARAAVCYGEVWHSCYGTCRQRAWTRWRLWIIMRGEPSDNLGLILRGWERARKVPGHWRPAWRLSGLRWSALRRLRWARRVDDVDYRDRISVATWMVVLSLGLGQLVALPTAQISFLAFGSPVAIPFTSTLLAALFAAVMAATGAESVVSVHPLMIAQRGQNGGERRLRPQSWGYWALPMAITIIAAVLLREAPSSVVQVAALCLSGGLLAAAYYGLYATIEPGRSGFRRARLWLDAMAYGSALLLFLFVYQTRARSLVSGSLVAVTAMLLAAEILRTTIDRPGLALNYGSIIGLILGQVTWALNYWVLPGLTGGLLLLLIFYLLVGIAQQGLQDRLTPRVLMEFGIFGVIALILIALVGPGFHFAPGP